MTVDRTAHDTDPPDATDPQSSTDVTDVDRVRRVLDATRAGVLDLIERSSVHPASVRLTVGEVSVEMDWARATTPPPAGPQAAAPAPPPTDPAATAPPEPRSGPVTVPVTAPAVGVFYRAPEPGAGPFVDVGDAVAPGQKVGLIEAMKLLIPVEADRHGTVAEIVGVNGEPVEYGQTLITLAPATGEE